MIQCVAQMLKYNIKGFDCIDIIVPLALHKVIMSCS